MMLRRIRRQLGYCVRMDRASSVVTRPDAVALPEQAPPDAAQSRACLLEQWLVGPADLVERCREWVECGTRLGRRPVTHGFGVGLKRH